MAGRAAYAGRRSRRETGQGRDGDPGRSRQQAGRTRTGCGAPWQFARLPGHRLHLHAGQRRPAVPSEPVEAFRRCEHRRHRRHGVRFHAAVRNHEAIHPGVRHRRVRVRDADRQTRRSLHRLSGIQRAAGGRRCRGLGRLHRLHARHQPFMGSGCRRHRPPVGYARVQGHRADRFVQDRGGLHQAAGHRLAYGRRQARPGHRHGVAQRHDRRP